MVTEFEIRREIAAVERERLHGPAKARRLLRIAQRVRRGAMALGHMSFRTLQNGDGEGAARFRTAARRLVELHEEIQHTARMALCPDAPTLGSDGLVGAGLRSTPQAEVALR